MKVKGWDIGLLFIILVISTVGVRVYYINHLMANVVINEDVYNQMKIIDVNGSLAVLSSIFHVNSIFNSIYLTLLYLAYLVIRNYTVAGVYLNIVFQTLTMILLFCYIYHVTRKYITFRICMLLTVFPSYVRRISFIDNNNMKILIIVCVAVVVLTGMDMVFNMINKRKNKAEEVHNDTPMKEEIALGDIEGKPLENPLPVPKRKKHKEMDYAVNLTEENNDFDIKQLPDNDDFDIK